MLAESFDSIFLKPCELYSTSAIAVVNTVLGSCVSITMFDKKTRYSAICHCMLPYADMAISRNDVCFKFVDCAVMHMAKLFSGRGITPAETEVKLFGGADMIQSMPGKAVDSVGKQNIQAAQKMLTTLGYKISAQDIGGVMGRKLFFYTETGKIYLKKISRI